METNGARARDSHLLAGLTRSTIILGLVSLMSDISSEMVYPILPIFLTQTLAAPATVVGLVEGIAVGTASIVSGFSGWLSDRLGRRKPVAFAGYALTAVSKPLIAFAPSWPMVLAARFADRFGKGVRGAPRDALLADTASAHHRGRAFGFERAMDYSGAILGPLLAFALVEGALVGVRTIFFLSFIPATVAALLILAVREPKTATGKTAKSIRLSLAGTTRQYRRVLLIAAVFGLANSANAFLILRARELGMDSGQAILAYTLYNAVAALLAMPAGAASDRLGRRNLLIAGYTIYAGVYVGVALAKEAWMIWPLFAIYGIFPALTDGVTKALAVDTAGALGRATAIGIYSTVIGVTQIIASYAGGMLWDRAGSWATFYLGAGLASLAALLLFLLIPARLRHEPAI